MNLTREETKSLVVEALQWARETLADGADPIPKVRRLALAVEALESGRRLAAQALDHAREHIETVSGHTEDEIEQEVLRICAYAAARMAGHLSTPLDPETLDGVQRAEICVRAFDIAERELRRIDAEQPEMVTDTEVLAAAVSMLATRAAALASQPRYSTCSWCGLKLLIDGDQWIRHSLECDKSPGAYAYRHLQETHRCLKLSAPGVLEVVRDATADAVRDVASLVAEAENARLLRATAGQQHERDCPDALSPHVTCEEPAPQRCDDCDPSFTTCFSDPDKCVKRPRPVAAVCLRAKSSTTPCFLKDGDLAESDDGRCVGCNLKTSEIK